MKGYCPNCGRYMAEVRRENKQLLHLICEPCEDLLWRDKPPPTSTKMPLQIDRPAHSKVILEVQPDGVLVVIPAAEWHSNGLAGLLFGTFGSAIAMLAISTTLITIEGAIFISILTPLIELALLIAWYDGFHLQRRLWLHEAGFVLESVIGRWSRNTINSPESFRKVSIGWEQDEESITYWLKFWFHNGNSWDFDVGLRRDEVAWLVSEIQHAPIFSNICYNRP